MSNLLLSLALLAPFISGSAAFGQSATESVEVDQATAGGHRHCLALEIGLRCCDYDASGQLIACHVVDDSGPAAATPGLPE